LSPFPIKPSQAPVFLNFVVPCYNEELVLGETARQIEALLEALRKGNVISDDSGVVYVDDGSIDDTWRLIESLNGCDSRCHGVKLSRNRGHQNALLAGLLSAPGDVLISMDADLQDDLAAVPRMLAEHAAGAEIVYGVRAARDSDSMFKRRSARAYYALLRRFGVEVLPDHADFRLMSRNSITALGGFREVNLFLRGIVPLLGFKTAVVAYDRLPRTAGVSKYPLGRMMALALDGIFSFSTVPLTWITMLGGVVSVLSIGIAFWALGVRLFSDRAIPGWTSTVVPLFLLGGVQLLSLGVIGSYVSRIYAETKQRPRFIIERSL
jgi:glycosyltransferase involved in cell wall biosynthesis